MKRYCTLTCLTAVLTMFAAAVPLMADASPGRGSCLTAQTAVPALKGASAQNADARMSVLRPCVGQVVAGSVEVIFSTGSGFTDRLDVRAGESLERRVGAAIGPGKQLVDIWPDRSILASVVDILAGRTPRTSGTSGFDTAGLAIAGELLPLPGTALPLKLYGWAPDQPVQLSQAGWTRAVQPQAGLLVLPVPLLKAGELKFTQGTREATLTVVALPEAEDVVRQWRTLAGTSAELRLQRAVLLQEQQFLVNAVSEYTRGP